MPFVRRTWKQRMAGMGRRRSGISEVGGSGVPAWE